MLTKPRLSLVSRRSMSSVAVRDLNGIVLREVADDNVGSEANHRRFRRAKYQQRRPFFGRQHPPHFELVILTQNDYKAVLSACAKAGLVGGVVSTLCTLFWFQRH